MKCPHCQTAFHERWTSKDVGGDRDCSLMAIQWNSCPECRRKIIRLVLDSEKSGSRSYPIVYPKAATRPIPPEVPDPYASDFREACLVLDDSPKASAAISRRCLQHIIREQAGITKKNLSEEIGALLSSKELSGHLAERVDAIRNVGNFAAHPIKSTNTGEIIEVEPGEAEWLLDVLESLFDFYFVQPTRLKARRDALNKKLEDAGKPPMKELDAQTAPGSTGHT